MRVRVASAGALALVCMCTAVAAQTLPASEVYGSREAAVCAGPLKSLAGAALSVPEASLIFTCRYEGRDDQASEIWFVERLEMAVGAPERYEFLHHNHFGAVVDQNREVYAVNGGYVSFTCYKISASRPQGANCSSRPHTFEGWVYWSKSGELKLDAIMTQGSVSYNVPPPQ